MKTFRNTIVSERKEYIFFSFPILDCDVPSFEYENTSIDLIELIMVSNHIKDLVVYLHKQHPIGMIVVMSMRTS